MRKGVVLTLDAIIALLASSALTASLFFSLSKIQQTQWTELDINEISLESLATLELNSNLKDAVDTGSTSTIKIFLDKLLPTHVCGKIEVYDSNSNLQLSETKTNCSAGEKISVARRTFITDNNIYYAKMETWFK